MNRQRASQGTEKRRGSAALLVELTRASKGQRWETLVKRLSKAKPCTEHGESHGKATVARK